MMSFEMNDRKKIGLGLTGLECSFHFWGSFSSSIGLLAMGNILFFSGVTLTIGLKSSVQFFMKRSNFKGTISFGVGFFLVIIGWPILGMIVEAYGFVVLFSGFWPTLAVFLQKMPIIGWLFQQPFVRSCAGSSLYIWTYNIILEKFSKVRWNRVSGAGRWGIPPEGWIENSGSGPADVKLDLFAHLLIQPKT